jgi:DNA-directed RNA polymerase subunit N (RpoN/RPB10)
MYCFIVCPECGRCIAQVYDLYLAICKKRVEDYLNEYDIDVDPAFISLCELSGLKMGDILYDLGLDSSCCRSHTISQVEFSEYA